MRVLFCRPLNEPDDGGHRCLATIDVELNDHVRLYALRLMQMRDGKQLLLAPQSGRRRVASFSPPMAERLTTLALDAYKGLAA